jgi:hypothetical protein
MGICTLIQIIFMVRGFSKKRKKVGTYNKPKEENKKKLELFLTKKENGK